jgi:CubicO group peptidase (beta-lactamase class C family)
MGGHAAAARLRQVYVPRIGKGTMRPDTAEQAGSSSRGLQGLRDALQHYVDRGSLGGVNALVAQHGRVVYRSSHGMRDVEGGKPMEQDTLLRIHSLTKPLTAAALLILLDEGHFELDDPVSRFIPAFQELKVLVKETQTGVQVTGLERPITIRHLLTHTAGLGYGLLNDSPVEEMYRRAQLFSSPLGVLQVSLSELIRRVSELPLAHQPGSAWRYSIAYDVIGYLAGLVSDTPFDEFLRERVLEPLGMKDTDFFVPEAKVDRFAAMYNVPRGGSLYLLDAPESSPFLEADRAPSGGGGLVSTVPDYLRFARLLLGGGELEGVRLLRRETVQMMTTNQLAASLLPIRLGDMRLAGMGYGMGVGVRVDDGSMGSSSFAASPAGPGTFWWAGVSGTYFWADPQVEMIGIVMPQTLNYWEPALAFQKLAYRALADDG